MGGTKSEMQTCWRRLTEFLEDTGLEMNTQKTLLLSNTYATEHPSLSLKGQEIKTLTNNEPFKILGIWFTMDMDWKYQKRRAGATLIATIEKLAKRKITDLQLVQIINTITFSGIAYGMTIVPYSEGEIRKIKEQLYFHLRKRLKIYDQKGWNDFFTAAIQ